jgi:hypothetical protein
MKRMTFGVTMLLLTLFSTQTALAFCGFYVAKADTKLFNQASQAEFGPFYKAMFGEAVKREGKQAVFLEYAWDMGWCDPCAADPLSPDELRQLGVFWIEERGWAPGGRGGVRDVFLTRLHVRYDAAHFPEDLVFQETADRTNFQGRYVLRHPWTGTDSCGAAAQYRAALARRQEEEVRVLASLTGWPMATIRAKAPISGEGKPPVTNWWQKLWGK